VTSKTDFPPVQGPDDLLALRAVLRVSESGSFSAAARALGVQVSSVTRAVQRVEARLGARLFRRTTHGVSLTEAGLAYAAHLARWLAEEDALRDRLAAMRGAAEGTLRVTVPVFVAERVLPRAVERFAREHPGAHLDVHASDDVRDLVKEAFDLAVRLGPLPDSMLRGRRVASFRRVLCAAPSFVERFGAPREPGALSALPCLLYGSGAGRVAWSFRHRSGRRARVEVSGPVRSNNLELLAALAAAGLGAARLPEWAARDGLRDGGLVELLPAWGRESERSLPSLFALYPDDPAKERLRRAFLALLEEEARSG
jgi:DNA-binding transcriptional LysR family regulator